MASLNRVFKGKTVNEAWEKAYSELAAQAASGHVQGSRDGSVVGEILNATLIVEDPTRMIVTSGIRKMPMRYAVGELMWYLSGSNKTRDIAQFSKVWNKLSDDGEFSNSAYGYRIFEKFGVNQWEAVKEMLTKDPLSRQAVIHIKAPQDNVCVSSTKDLPCTLNLQFFIRDNKLHMTTNMRSNDIWTGTPYDMFSFCCMQVKMAMELNLEVGTYTHNAASLHLYGRNYTNSDEGSNKENKKTWSELQKELGEVIAVDFDGTLCKDKFPNIGSPNNLLIKDLIKRKENGAKLILWTCRQGAQLDEAVEWCLLNGLEFDSVNKNLPEVIDFFGYDTRKVWATMYIDDKGVKCNG